MNVNAKFLYQGLELKCHATKEPGFALAFAFVSNEVGDIRFSARKRQQWLFDLIPELKFRIITNFKRKYHYLAISNKF